MKKVELLAPAGNWDNMVAAIEAGADAVYLGGSHFGARAFSKNFTDEMIAEAIKYCHLYGVKVYVTVNTLIYDDEVEEFINYIRFLHKSNVDAILIQDFGMLDLVRKKFPNLEVHSSTQMHIHNLDGTKLMEKLGVKRVVLARETSIEEIKYIKENSNVELEVFVHGALCISYSGQCLMSSLIGGRSGNRGTCAGSCRLNYDVIDDDGNKLNKGDYPLSTRDLNTINNISKLIDIGVSSLKIEGRMKSKEYVYMVVSLYRHAIDSYYENKEIKVNEEELLKLKKIFNRNYTDGFIFNTKNNDLMNTYRPNHMGVSIGKVIDYKSNIAYIKLTDKVSIGSGLRVIGKRDVGINVNDFYVNNKLVKEATAGETISIKVNDKVEINDDVVITLDKSLFDEIDDKISSKSRKVNITGIFIAKLNDNIRFIISDGINKVEIIGSVVTSSINNSINKEVIKEKLNKIRDTVYAYTNLLIEIDNNIFIPLKELNELRRMAVEKLNNKRLYNIKYIEKEYVIEVPDFKKEKLISILSNNIPNIKYDILYSEEIDNAVLKLPRVINIYPNTNKELLVGEIGAFNKFKNINTDFSLNVVNSYTVAFLHNLGAKRITLSYELSDYQIENLTKNYKNRYKKNPNLELIVEGYEEVMISKFSLEQYYKKHVNLRDRFGNIYKVREKNGLMYIYNYRKRNIFNEKYYDIGINSLRINIDL